MKAAIIISGHIRDFLRVGRLHQTYTAMRAALENADVFVHTWAVNDHRDRVPRRDIAQAKLREVLKPTAIYIEPPRDFTEELKPLSDAEPYYHDNYSLSRILPQWYGVSKAWEVLEASGKSYDLVVRHRFDFIAELHLRPKPGVLTVPVVAKRYRNPCNFMVDNHAYGDSEVMRVYAGLYRSIPEYTTSGLPSLLRFAGGHYLDSEIMLRYHLKRHNVPIAEDRKYGLIMRLPRRFDRRAP